MGLRLARCLLGPLAQLHPHMPAWAAPMLNPWSGLRCLLGAIGGGLKEALVLQVLQQLPS